MLLSCVVAVFPPILASFIFSLVGILVNLGWFHNLFTLCQYPHIRSLGLGHPLFMLIIYVFISVRTSGGNAGGANCVFPFIYGNNSYDTCTMLAANQLWCSTTSNYNTNPIWGYCNGKCTPINHTWYYIIVTYVVSEHFNHFLCIKICDTPRTDLCKLTFIYLRMDEYWLTSYMPK